MDRGFYVCHPTIVSEVIFTQKTKSQYEGKNDGADLFRFNYNPGFPASSALGVSFIREDEANLER